MTCEHELILGDCLAGMKGLADGSVAHTICDPPYEAEAHKNAMRSARKGEGATAFAAVEYKISFEAITEEIRSDAAREIVRVTRGWALVFCQAEGVERWRAALEAAGAKWRRVAVWIKPDGAPQFTGDRPAQAFECISMAWCRDGRSKWNGGGKRGLYEHSVNVGEFGVGNRRPHPTTKPLPLMEALVRDFTDPGEIILDPFAGSGTTGVACKRLGRRFLGFERDPKFHAAAVKRLEATSQQYEFALRPAKPKQIKMGGMP